MAVREHSLLLKKYFKKVLPNLGESTNFYKKKAHLIFLVNVGFCWRPRILAGRQAGR